MAGTLTLAFSSVYQNSLANIAKVDRSSGNVAVATTGSKFNAGVQNIGTVEETFDKGDVGTIGYVQLHNLDAVNFVQVGATTGVYSIRLGPGEWALFRLDAGSVYAKADTATCNVEFLIVET